MALCYYCANQMISPIDVIVEGRCVSLLFNVTTELYND